jgi:LmbE family N-acetylglucosaminyl deacetylase
MDARPMNDPKIAARRACAAAATLAVLMPLSLGCGSAPELAHSEPATQSRQADDLPPAIFYVPHQDDDYLGMSLGIPEHVAAGRRVKVILYTNGGNPGLTAIMNGTTACPLYGSSDPAYAGHEQYHHYNFTDDDTKRVRTEEFERSMAALGVTDITETGWEDDATTGMPGDPFVDKLAALILQNEQQYPGTSHKCIAGNRDCRPTWAGSTPFPTHIACWSAALKLTQEHPEIWWDFHFYDDYVYWLSSNPADWNRQFTYGLSQFMGQKSWSFEAYHAWDPGNGKYALGYHSVPFLFDVAKNDASVHIEMLGEPGTDVNYKCPGAP